MLVINVILFLIITITHQLNIEVFNSDLITKDCIFKIYNDTDRYLLILYSNAKYMDYIVEWKSSYVINLNTKIKFKTHLEKVNYYIFLIDNSKQFYKFVNNTYYTSFWNPRAKFVIILFGLLEKSEDIFNIAWEYYAVDFIVLSDRKIYSYFPFYDGNCEDTTMRLLTQCDKLEIHKLFSNKIPNTTNGCPMKIAPFFNPPYIKNPSLKGDNIKNVGLEAVVLNNLLQRCNLTIIYVNNSFSLWGYKFPDGSSTLLYNWLFNKKCHGIAGQININESFYYDFDATIFYLYEYSRWFVPLAGATVDWMNLVLIFQRNLWIAVVVTFVINWMIWWALGYGVLEKNLYTSPSFCFVNTLYILLQGSVSNPPSRALKLLYIFWVFMTLLLTTAYQSKLISVLENPYSYDQISTIQEMVDAQLPFGSIPSARNFFRSVDNKEDQLVYDNFISCPIAEQCIDLVFQGKFGFMMPEMLMSYRIPLYLKHNETNNNVYAFKKVVKPIMYNMYTVRGYPFLDRFNEIILRLQQNGLIWKWTDEIKITAKNIIEDDFKPLTLFNFFSCLVILGTGFVISVICFSLEVFLDYCIKFIHSNKISS